MIDTLQARLAEGSLPGAGPGLFRLAGRTAVETIARAAEAAGWRFIHVDAARVKTKAEFLAAVGEALHFPEWAGHNWDAFEELMHELSWLPPARGYLVLFDHLTAFATGHPKDMETAIDILNAALGNRLNARAMPVVILLRGASRAARRMPAIAIEPPQQATGE